MRSLRSFFFCSAGERSAVLDSAPVKAGVEDASKAGAFRRC
jgi:hypothetical protein